MLGHFQMRFEPHDSRPERQTLTLSFASNLAWLPLVVLQKKNVPCSIFPIDHHYKRDVDL